MNQDTNQNFNISQKYGTKMRRTGEAYEQIIGNRSPSEPKLITDRTVTMMPSAATKEKSTNAALMDDLPESPTRYEALKIQQSMPI